LHTARIAIVDDDRLFVEYLATFLRSRGYEPVVYSDGPSLLKALPASQPDAVLLDVLMPHMNGLEILQALRAATPAMPVIMLSGQRMPATIVEAVRLGAVDYVVKSSESAGLQEADLEATICRALERVTLTEEVARLEGQLAEPSDGSQVCWSSGSAMRDVMTMVERVADSDVSVLITGESGVGKEVIARELHRRSARRLKNFVKVNCAALPSELLESELFGHERGAFTGAQNTRIGKFEFAHEGSILLDEISEMPVALQAKLLHVLQDQQFTRLGGNRPVSVDVRVMATTNRPLDEIIRGGQFREDLYYRLQVIEIRVPPLRARREEIRGLQEFFLRRYAERYGRPAVRLPGELREALLAHSWPGNVRELENMMKRFVILQDEALLLADLRRRHSPEPVPTPVAEPRPAPDGAPASRVDGAEPRGLESTGPLRELARAAALSAERQAIQQALDQFHWNRRKAAQRLGVSYKTLLNKMKECGISDPAASDG
jgi:two-component system response regulator AtoC